MISEDRAIDCLPLASNRRYGIPAIDLAWPATKVEAGVAQACREWGLFLVTGHPIDGAFRRRFLGEMRRFFALPTADKRTLSRSLDNPWGYYDRELTKTIRDRKEIFDIGPDLGEAGGGDPADPFAGATPWPAGLADFSAIMLEAMARLEGLALHLIDIVMRGLGETGTAAANAFRPAPTSFLRLNRYPVGDPLADLGRGDAGRGVHHHSDAGALTVLIEDGTPGLQVLRDGHWHDVEPAPGALVVNIGDMIQVWSNDTYRAPLHRVLAARDRDRYSAPFFLNPSYRAEVAPLPGLAAQAGGARYRPIPWSEFRRRRAEGDFGDYGREVQIGDYAAALGGVPPQVC